VFSFTYNILSGESASVGALTVGGQANTSAVAEGVSEGRRAGVWLAVGVEVETIVLWETTDVVAAKGDGVGVKPAGVTRLQAVKPIKRKQKRSNQEVL